MTRLLTPAEHIAQAIVRLFSADGCTYRVERVEPDGLGILVVIEAVTAGQIIMVRIGLGASWPTASTAADAFPEPWDLMCPQCEWQVTDDIRERACALCGAAMVPVPS